MLSVWISLFQVILPKGLFPSMFQNLVDLAGSERAAQTGAEGNENSCSVGLNVFLFYRIKSASMHFRN